MWKCVKCREELEDSFEVCWNCGTSKDGVEDPTFRKADEPAPESADTRIQATPRGDERTPDRERPATGPAEYEFTPQQHEVFAGLASAMSFVGICIIILAVLSFVSGFAGNPGGFIAGGIYLLLGIWTMSAANSFRRIVDTKGQDITNLMAAIESLRSLYNLQRILILIGLVIMGIAFVILVSKGMQ
jgi:hypothetical protein